MSDSPEIYRGLKSHVHDSFPRHCRKCGRSYESFECFFFETAAPGSSGLRESRDVGRAPFVEMLRVCQCGTPIIQPCDDRRNRNSIPREQFAHVLARLAAKGIDATQVEAELRKLVRGEESDLI